MELKLEPLKSGCYLLMLVSLSPGDCVSDSGKAIASQVLAAHHKATQVLETCKLDSKYGFLRKLSAVGVRSMLGYTPGPEADKTKARLFLFSLAAAMAETRHRAAARAERGVPAGTQLQSREGGFTLGKSATS